MALKTTIRITPLGDKLEQFIYQANTAKMSAGFFDDKYPDGTSISQVAKDNDYGVVQKRQPPRPFMRYALGRNGSRWINQAKFNVRKIFKGGGDLDSVMDELGKIVVNDIKREIKSLHSPELAPYTIAKRRERGNMSVKPLEDTMTMYNSVTHKVSK